jgi:hypothetical protein
LLLNDKQLPSSNGELLVHVVKTLEKTNSDLGDIKTMVAGMEVKLDYTCSASENNATKLDDLVQVWASRVPWPFVIALTALCSTLSAIITGIVVK